MGLSSDTNDRVSRALESLQGLSVGDAFGEQFFGPPAYAQDLIANRRPPPPEWRYTDDTEMTLSVIDVLLQHGSVQQDELALAFARRHEEDPNRGYGAGARQALRAITAGTPWSQVAAEMFEGQGSLGNGAAMRVGPLGAYFADDLDLVVSEAIKSAVVTHNHPEGQAGAVAVALAAAFACISRWAPHQLNGAGLLEFVESRMPAGETRLGVRKALAMPEGTSVEHAAAVLGTGAKVSAPDTVPFSLWSAATRLDNYEEALWNTVAGLGDRDTTCAIVGGIVVMKTGLPGIPEKWLVSRESLAMRYKPKPASALPTEPN
jgi:ADP-ribosylglycohydrolase